MEGVAGLDLALEVEVVVFFQGLDSVSCVLCDVPEVVENESVVVGGDYPC